MLNWPMAGIGNRLRTHPTEVLKLSRFRVAVGKLAHGNLQILSVTSTHLVAAVAISQQVGLLTNDVVIVTLMQANGLSKIASNDADFDRVPGITRYSPI